MRTEIVIDRPRAVVASYAADPSNASEWYQNIEAVEWQTEPPLASGSRLAFVARFLGRRLAYTYEVVEFQPEARLVMRTHEGPFPMETSYTWRDLQSGTAMTLENRGTPSGFAAYASPLLAQAVRRANRKDLARLKRLLEQR